MFKEHAARVKNQYRELRDLKLKLPKGHIIAQMDFAENYSFLSLENDQSAYWDQAEQVAVYPVVFFTLETRKGSSATKALLQ